MEKTPNAWQAIRIIEDALKALRKKGASDEKIALNSVFIVEEIKKDSFRWLLEQSEEIFKQKLKSSTVSARLVLFSNLIATCVPLAFELKVQYPRLLYRLLPKTFFIILVGTIVISFKI